MIPAEIVQLGHQGDACADPWNHDAEHFILRGALTGDPWLWESVYGIHVEIDKRTGLPWFWKRMGCGCNWIAGMVRS